VIATAMGMGEDARAFISARLPSRGAICTECKSAAINSGATSCPLGPPASMVAFTLLPLCLNPHQISLLVA
jgi:hypothetical protein